MNKHTTLLAGLTGAVLLAGCGDSTNTSGTGTSGGVSATISEATEAAKKTASDSAAAVEKTASDASAAAKKATDDAMAAVNTQYQSAIESVKKLIAEGKGTEAMSKLKDLTSNLKLTPEQKKMVDDLMAQAQKALAGGADAAKKTVDNLLKK
ncbi:MAG: hypothetical protein ACKVYV_09775 [Limisphaerales bacterium]